MLWPLALLNLCIHFRDFGLKMLLGRLGHAGWEK